MSMYLEVPRHIVERFADILAQRAQLATAVRTLAQGRCMNNGFAWQVCREGARCTAQRCDVIRLLRVDDCISGKAPANTVL